MDSRPKAIHIHSATRIILAGLMATGKVIGRNMDNRDWSWFQLVWRTYDYKEQGSITHACNNQNEIACGRKFGYSDWGTDTKDDPNLIPACFQCARVIAKWRSGRIQQDKAQK